MYILLLFEVLPYHLSSLVNSLIVVAYIQQPRLYSLGFIGASVEYLIRLLQSLFHNSVIDIHLSLVHG